MCAAKTEAETRNRGKKQTHIICMFSAKHLNEIYIVPYATCRKCVNVCARRGRAKKVISSRGKKAFGMSLKLEWKWIGRRSFIDVRLKRRERMEEPK